MPYISNPTKDRRGRWSVKVQFKNRRRKPPVKTQTVKHSNRSVALSAAQQMIDWYETKRFDPWVDNFLIEEQEHSTLMLEEAADLFLASRRERLTRDSYSAYTYQIKRLKTEFGATRNIASITRDEVITVTRNLHRDLAYNMIIMLSMIYKHLISAGYIDQRPDLKGIVKPQNTQRLRYITPEEIGLLHKYFIDRCRYYWNKTPYRQLNEVYKQVTIIKVMYLMFFTGRRGQEITMVTYSDVDPRSRSIDLPILKKRQETRFSFYYGSIPLLKRIIEGHLRYARHHGIYAPDAPFFSLSLFSIRRRLKEAMRAVLPPKRAEELQSTHSFRHGSATYLLKQGVSLSYIRHHLQHESIAQTQKYSQVIDEEYRKSISHAFNSGDRQMTTVKKDDQNSTKP